MRDKITEHHKMGHTPVQGNYVLLNDCRYMTHKTDSCTNDNERIENQAVKKNCRSHSYVFNLGIKDERQTIIHKKQKSIVQKYLFNRFQEQSNNNKGFTPFQSRKIEEKSRAMKIFSKFKNYKKNEYSLQQHHNNCLMVKEIDFKKESKQQKLTHSHIRETQTSLKDHQSQDNYLYSTQLSVQSPKSTLKMGEYLQKSNQMYKTSNKVKFKNVKMTLKQLFKNNKSLMFNSKNKLDPNFSKQSIKNNLSMICKTNSHFLKNSKGQKRFFEVISQKSSFHKQKYKSISQQSQHNIVKRHQIQSHIASAISIIPISKQSMSKNQKQKMTKSHSSNKSFCSPSNCQTEQNSKYRSIKKIPSAKQISKEDKYHFEGWEYTNDFSERQQFF